MKKETRFDMLTHIDEKYLNEAYPKKRNPTAIIIPAIACACALALISPAAITALRLNNANEGTNSSANVVLEADQEMLEQESQENTFPQAPTDQSVKPETPTETQKPTKPSIEPITLTPIVIEDTVRDAYLDGYATILIAEEDTSYGGEACFAKPPETEEVSFTWDDVLDYYGKDVRPLYVPESIKSIDMESAEYTFSRVTVANPPYNVGDYYRDSVYMAYKESPERELSPANRGVYITAKKTHYTDVTETMRYKMTPNAEKSLSYYNGVPVFFFVNSERWSCSVMNGSEALTETNDIHLTEEYQALLEEFITQRPELLEDEYFRGEVMKDWDSFLKQNGIPDGEPTFNERHWFDNHHYFATLVYDGIEYTLESNLDFETFAAIAASLIHE